VPSVGSITQSIRATAGHERTCKGAVRCAGVVAFFFFFVTRAAERLDKRSWRACPTSGSSGRVWLLTLVNAVALVDAAVVEDDHDDGQPVAADGLNSMPDKAERASPSMARPVHRYRRRLAIA